LENRADRVCGSADTREARCAYGRDLIPLAGDKRSGIDDGVICPADVYILVDGDGESI
jgi:hypothetical protein